MSQEKFHVREVDTKFKLCFVWRMGTCKLCGEKAGFLKSSHKECVKKHTDTCAKLPEIFQQALSSKIGVSEFVQRFDEIAKSAWIDEAKRREIIIQGLERQASHALDDGILTNDEETRIVSFQNSFGITANDLSDSHFQKALTKAAIMRDLDANIVKSRIQLEGGHSFLLGRGEFIIWAFNNVTLYEHKTRTSFVGRSQGVSVRIAKGVYVRAGSSKGQKIETTNLEAVDVGVVAITNEHFIFGGTSKSVKIKFPKIISLKVFSDALEVTKEATNPKPQMFSIDDPTFAANLINKIAALN